MKSGVKKYFLSIYIVLTSIFGFGYAGQDHQTENFKASNISNEFDFSGVSSNKISFSEKENQCPKAGLLIFEKGIDDDEKGDESLNVPFDSETLAIYACSFKEFAQANKAFYKLHEKHSICRYILYQVFRI